MTLTDVLRAAWLSPFTTRGNFARENAELVAMSASDGFVTTRIAAGLYGNRWAITAAGLKHIALLTADHEADPA